jgi:hypothetical protein
MGRATDDDPWVEYVNFAAQLATVGIEPPTSVESESYFDLFQSMSILPHLFLMLSPFEWPDAFFGFNPGDIDEYLLANVGRDMFIVLHGRFDEERLVDSWTRAGYTEYRVGDVPAWTIRGDHRIEPGDDAFALGMMNFATILRDDVIAFSNFKAGLGDIIAAAQDRILSLADRPDVVTLVGAVDPMLAGAYISRGQDIGSSADLVLLGATPGSYLVHDFDSGTPVAALVPPDAPPSHAQIALLYPDGSDAFAIASEIAGRLSRETSKGYDPEGYADLFPVRSVLPVDGSPMVVIDLVSEKDSAARLVGQLTKMLDFGFLV